MTNKVQKIKDWISKEQDDLRFANGNFEYPEYEGAFHVLSNLNNYIDSLQEEPVSEVWHNASEEPKEGYTIVVYMNDDSLKVLTSWGENGDFCIGDGFWYNIHQQRSWAYKDDLLDKKEEPVSEDLEDAAFDYAEACKYEGGERLLCVEHFKAGAQWQAKQFEKNRLKHCNSITNEQAELEQGFIDQHLDKYNRMPTYLDAIEYGMKLQKERMIAKAVDGVVTFDYYGDDDKTYGCIAHDSFCLENFGLEDRDKVKVILIKED